MYFNSVFKVVIMHIKYILLKCHTSWFTYTRDIWKVMHIHPYNFTQLWEKNDEGIGVNVRIWGFWEYHFLMFALMR